MDDDRSLIIVVSVSITQLDYPITITFALANYRRYVCTCKHYGHEAYRLITIIDEDVADGKIPVIRVDREREREREDGKKKLSPLLKQQNFLRRNNADK